MDKTKNLLLTKVVGGVNDKETVFGEVYSIYNAMSTGSASDNGFDQFLAFMGVAVHLADQMGTDNQQVNLRHLRDEVSELVSLTPAPTHVQIFGSIATDIAKLKAGDDPAVLLGLFDNPSDELNLLLQVNSLEQVSDELTRGNFLKHHLYGATVAHIVLPQFELEPAAVRQVERIAIDHQYAPMSFMPVAMGGGLNGQDKSTVELITKKLANPFKYSDGSGSIRFTGPEKTVLKSVGLSFWPAPNDQISVPIVIADGLANYANYRGWVKLLKDRASLPFIHDKSIWKAIDSFRESLESVYVGLKSHSMNTVDVADHWGRFEKSQVVVEAILEELPASEWMQPFFQRGNTSDVERRDKIRLTNLVCDELAKLSIDKSV